MTNFKLTLKEIREIAAGARSDDDLLEQLDEEIPYVDDASASDTERRFEALYWAQARGREFMNGTRK